MAIGRKTGGRAKGSRNKATADVKALAMAYVPEAVKALAKIMQSGESDAARVAAANAILDRACGKPKQALVGGDEGDAPIKTELKITFV